MTALRRLPALLLVLLGGAVVWPAGASAATLRADLKGIQIVGVHADTTLADIDGDLTAAQQLGARVVRSEVRWDAIEPTPGAYDAAYLAKADHLIAAAHARKIKVFLTILGTPCWASSAPLPDCSTEAGREAAAFYPPTDNGAFARAAADVARRWAPDLAALEIWNEPDQINELYWKGTGKATTYTALLQAAYPAIKSAAPSVRVAGAAMVGANGRFLQALYAAGAKGSYDLLSVHYYDLVLLSLNDIRKIRAAAGDRAPLWLAEYGWTSCLTKTRRTQDQHSCVDRATQAANTLDALRVLARSKDVAGATLYSLRDGQYDFGALDVAGAHKPLFGALSRAYHGKLGAERAITLRLRVAGRQIVASGRGPAGDAYLLEARVAGRLRYRVAFRGDRFNRFSVKLPAAVGTHGVSVRVVRFSVGGHAATHRI